MTMLNIRTLAAIAAISLLSACGGEQSIPLQSAAPRAMTQPAPIGAPVPGHAGLQGGACAVPACQQGPADLADQYRTESRERAKQDGGAEMPSYPHVPESAIVIAEGHPSEVLGTAARVVVR